MKIITLTNLTKIYDSKTIIRSVSHTFHAGQPVALMGHNGCGKSTLLKLAAGIVAPTSGAVIHHCPLLFHYVPEKFLPLPMTGRTYLTRMGELDGMKKNEIRQQIEKLGNDFFLSELLDTSMKSLSKGTLQKISVIQALLKKPDVLLLDEPLSGQDTASQKVFISKINELTKEGVTVLMSCHEQHLVDAVSEQVYTIRDGQLLPFQPERERVYALILERSPFSPETFPPVSEGMTKYGTGYKLLVNEDKKDRILLELLQDGWTLKGMYDEETNESGKISAAALF